MRSFRLVLALAALLPAGCTPDPSEVDPGDLPARPAQLAARSFATGSASLVVHAGSVWTANTDAGTVTRLDTRTGAVVQIPVGGEPTRIAAHEGRLFVTLRGERALAEIDASAPEAGVTRVVHVGAEPYGVVVREDGLRIYVALSQEDAVVELDGATLEVVRRHEVRGEPRYLALHPSGATLYVGSGRGEARLTAIDLRDGTSAVVPLPATRRLAEAGDIPLVPRLTGDLWIDPDGQTLLVPALYADNVTPIREVEEGEPIVIEPEPGSEGYGGTGDGVDKFTPGVIEVPVGASGQALGDSRAVFVSTTVFTQNGTNVNVGSYISSVSVDPTTGHWLATMEASKAALMIDPDAWVMSTGMVTDAMPFPGDGSFGFFTDPESGGFAPVALAPIRAGTGTTGAVFDADGEAYIHNGFDGSVDLADEGRARQILTDNAANQMNVMGDVPRGTRHVVASSPLPANVRAGRELFFSATDSAMGVGGISCSTCHFEGRNDGLTWTFESGVRQTPSLAGVVSATAPVTWTSNVTSVAAEADLTSRGRMGGAGLGVGQLDAIAAYVDWSREVDVQHKGSTEPAVLRGKALFERADVGCASCHSGDALTDNTGHTIRGVAGLNTPGLRGVAATGPYLHDGTMSTLRGVLEWSRSGVMGDTSMLSETEMDDLELYLRSL